MPNPPRELAQAITEAAITDQRIAARRRFGNGSMEGTLMDVHEKFATLGEEFGEVAREVNTYLRTKTTTEPLKHGEYDPRKLIAELDQVAACAIMWATAERMKL